MKRDGLVVLLFILGVVSTGVVAYYVWGIPEQEALNSLRDYCREQGFDDLALNGRVVNYADGSQHIKCVVRGVVKRIPYTPD